MLSLADIVIYRNGKTVLMWEDSESTSRTTYVVRLRNAAGEVVGTYSIRRATSIEVSVPSGVYSWELTSYDRNNQVVDSAHSQPTRFNDWKSTPPTFLVDSISSTLSQVGVGKDSQSIVIQIASKGSARETYQMQIPCSKAADLDFLLRDNLLVIRNSRDHSLQILRNNGSFWVLEGKFSGVDAGGKMLTDANGTHLSVGGKLYSWYGTLWREDATFSGSTVEVLGRILLVTSRPGSNRLEVQQMLGNGQFQARGAIVLTAAEAAAFRTSNAIAIHENSILLNTGIGQFSVYEQNQNSTWNVIDGLKLPGSAQYASCKIMRLEFNGNRLLIDFDAALKDGGKSSGYVVYEPASSGWTQVQAQEFVDGNHSFMWNGSNLLQIKENGSKQNITLPTSGSTSNGNTPSAGIDWAKAPLLELGKTLNDDLGANRNLSDGFRIPVKNGEFTISGEFGSLKAKATLYTVKGKKIASATVKNGKLSFAPQLLTTGEYLLIIESTDKGKTAGNYSVKLNGYEFPEATKDNMLSSATLLELQSGKAKVEGWVGFGDAVDIYRILPTQAGALNLTLTGLDSTKLKITLWDVRGRKLKTVAVKKAGLQLSNFLLLPGTAYVSVESADGGKGKYNSHYTLEIDDKYFPAATDDNAIAQAVKVDLAEGNGTVSGWVGFGDAVNFYRINPAEAGVLKLTISNCVAKTLKISLWNAQGKRLKTVAVKDAGTILSNYLLPAGVAYISVEAADGGKGKYNSDYTLEITDKYFPAATNDNTLTKAEVLELREGQAVVSGWVGYGDGANFYKIAPEKAGSLSLNISNCEAKSLKVTLWNAQGKKLKVLSVKAAGSVLSNYLLPAGVAYVSVEAADGGKGKYNSDYTLEITDKYFPAATDDNNWSDAIEVDPQSVERVSGWVGYGDKMDCYKIDLTESGRVDFDLSLPGQAKSSHIKIELYNSAGKKLQLDRNLTSKELTEGSYMVSVRVTDEKKYNSNSYQLGISVL